MTTVYFVRHAEADHTVHEGAVRPLTAKGRADCALVVSFFEGKRLDCLFTSPYRRAIETVTPLAERHGLAPVIIQGFFERLSDTDMTRRTEGWESFMERQWREPGYTYSDGESLQTVQNRNIAALNKLLAAHEGESFAIGTHGTALSTIINYYDASYGYVDFKAMERLTPWIVVMEFEQLACKSIDKINILI